MILDKLDEHLDVTKDGIIFSSKSYPKSLTDTKQKQSYIYYENITDLIHYAIALYFIRGEISSAWMPYILGVFIYRLIGVGIMTFDNQMWINDVFGDVFKEMLLASAFLGKSWANIWFTISTLILHAVVPFWRVYDMILDYFGI